MQLNDSVTLTRDVEASVVPVGTKVTLQKGEQAYITQSLGGTYSVVVNGNMFRIDGKDDQRHRPAAHEGRVGKGSLGPAQDLLRSGNPGQHCGPRIDLRLPSRTH